MTCTKPNNSLHGSRVALGLPTLTALRKLQVNLSKGTINEIVIRATISFAAIIRLLVYFCLERKRVKRVNKVKAEANKKETELKKARNEKYQTIVSLTPVVPFGQGQ